MTPPPSRRARRLRRPDSDLRPFPRGRLPASRPARPRIRIRYPARRPKRQARKQIPQRIGGACAPVRRKSASGRRAACRFPRFQAVPPCPALSAPSRPARCAPLPDPFRILFQGWPRPSLPAGGKESACPMQAQRLALRQAETRAFQRRELPCRTFPCRALPSCPSCRPSCSVCLPFPLREPCPGGSAAPDSGRDGRRSGRRGPFWPGASAKPAMRTSTAMPNRCSSCVRRSRLWLSR